MSESKILLVEQAGEKRQPEGRYPLTDTTTARRQKQSVEIQRTDHPGLTVFDLEGRLTFTAAAGMGRRGHPPRPQPREVSWALRWRACCDIKR
jgi:hypothetical protein